jgi:tetratricopeptide (TPR) repeat protein
MDSLCKRTYPDRCIVCWGSGGIGNHPDVVILHTKLFLESFLYTIGRMNKPKINKVADLYKQALAAKAQGNNQQAYSLCQDILRIFPNQPEPLGLMGILLAESGHKIDALDCLTRALAVLKDPSTYNNRGNLYQNLHQFELALDDYNAALKINPRFTEAHYNKGNCYKELNDFKKAIECYQEAIKTNPKYYTAYTNMGLCYQQLQNFKDAITSFDKAIEINPNYYAPYNNRGFAKHVMMDLDGSIADFKKSIELAPNVNDSKFNIGFVYLLKGDLENGWAGHETRWNNKYKPSNLPRLWRGEDITGKTLYIYHEQGLGDTIQFIRYVKEVKEAGAAKIIAGVKPEIAKLVATLPEIDEILTDSKAMPEYDYQSPMMSLPYIFKTRVGNIPYNRYLYADPEKVHEFSMKMSNKNNKLRVGLVWSGGFRADQPDVWAVNERRNIPMEKLSQIYNSSVEFYNLQFGAKEYPFPMVDLMGDVKDFSDTAALIENLDLLITVDTSTAHVAGAMGKPVWLMNRFDTCWRWLEDRTDTPWYPSFKIYRQKKFMNWDPVIEQIRKDLNDFVL